MAEKNDIDAKPTPADNNSNCSICLDPFKDPRLLPCCHTFCKSCLERTFQQQNKPPKQYPATSLAKFKGSASPLSPLKTKDASSEDQPSLQTAGDCLSNIDELDVPTSIEVERPFTFPTMPQETVPSFLDQSPVKEDEAMASVVHEEERPAARIRCPLCKISHTIPEGGIESFPPDYSMVQWIESESVTKSLSKSHVKKCESCSEEDKEIVGVCDECKLVCKDCAALHEKLAVYKTHTVTPLNEYSPESHISRRKQEPCTAHNKEIVFYCDTCSQLICPDCVLQRHKVHNLISLEEADKTLCMTVRELSKSAHHTMTIFRSYKEYIQGVETELGKEGYTKELKRRINARFEEHIRELQARREALLGKVEDNEVLAKKNLWAQRDHIDKTIAKIESGMRFTDRALKCSNTTERIKMNKHGKEVLSQVADAKWDHESIPPPLVYRCNEDVDILLSFGEVSPISSSDIRIELDNQCDMGFVKSKLKSSSIEVKLEEHTVIKLKFLVPLIKAASLLVQILYGKKGQILDKEEVVVYESEDESDTWNVEFVPRCAGKHLVQVWVEGRVVTHEEITVTGSPKAGSKVRSGPDWGNGPSTLTVGRVVSYSMFSKTVQVDWSEQEEENAGYLSDDEEPVEMATAGVDRNVTEHKWGQNEEYEVELVL